MKRRIYDELSEAVSHQVGFSELSKFPQQRVSRSVRIAIKKLGGWSHDILHPARIDFIFGDAAFTGKLDRGTLSSNRRIHLEIAYPVNSHTTKISA